MFFKIGLNCRKSTRIKDMHFVTYFSNNERQGTNNESLTLLLLSLNLR